VLCADKAHAEERSLEDAGTELEILRGDVVDGPAGRERRRDDRPRGRAGDQIEVVAQPETWIVPVADPELVFHLLENAERQDPARRAACGAGLPPSRAIRTSSSRFKARSTRISAACRSSRMPRRCRS